MITFQIKTTDPKKYLVRPSQSVLEVGGEIMIVITNKKPTNIEKSEAKDRFKIFTYLVPDDVEVPDDLDESGDYFQTYLWKELEE